METQNLNQLSEYSLDEIKTKSNEIFDIIQLSKAKEDALNGEFVSEEEAFEYLENVN